MREPELRPKTVESYRWQLEQHLIPHFGSTRLDDIGPIDIDRYRSQQLRKAVLGPNQVNKTIGLIARILDTAADYGHLDPARNPARGRRRRAKATLPNRAAIEPEQLPSLLDAASIHRPLIATMVGAGLRNGEACALDWASIDLSAGTISVATGKTDAASRVVDMPTGLRSELSTLAERAAQDGIAFPNRNGARQTTSNVGRRFRTVVRHANEQLELLGLNPIDERATPHSLRRLYASLRFALGDDPVYVAEQLGHTDPTFSMKVYARAIRRRERLTGIALREFDAALAWLKSEIGTMSDRPTWSCLFRGPKATSSFSAQSARQWTDQPR